MPRQFKFLSKLLISSLLAMCALSAQAQKDDSANGKDHPLLSRMAGYKIYNPVKVTEFDELVEMGLNCGRTICADTVPGFKGGAFRAEGKITKITYAKSPEPANEVAILRNYENAIKELGGRKIAQSSNDPTFAGGKHLFLIDKSPAKVWVILSTFGGQSYDLAYVEEKAMTQSVTAGKMAEEITKQGYATLYINFDNNKADLKPDAQPTMNELVALLKKDTALRLSIEGHTDNVGNAAANKTLSEQRATSVMKALIAGGIDAKRLSAKGLGSEAPVADNRTEEGRAKNRRVELVKVK